MYHGTSHSQEGNAFTRFDTYGSNYGLMGQGRRDRGSGAQAVLRETDDFNLSLSLNIDRGRDVADTERLKGVPDVRATLRARVRALQPH